MNDPKNTNFLEPTGDADPFISLYIVGPFLNIKPVDLSALKVGEKIPKENIKIVSGLEQTEDLEGFEEIGETAKIEIPTVKCTIQKESEKNGCTQLKIDGSYSGSCSEDLLLYIMAYNMRDDLIGYHAEVSVDQGFSGKKRFSEKMSLPSHEQIHRIVLRFARFWF